MQANRRHMETQTKIHTERRWMEKRANKMAWVKWGRGNEKQMANNVMRGIRVCDGYLVCLDLCIDLPGNGARNRTLAGDRILTWLGVSLPGNGARNPSCYLLSTMLDFLEEERMMQQSSVSISLSFWEPRYQSSRRPRTSPSHLHKQIITSQPTR